MERPKYYDCYTVWREYFLSLPAFEFIAEINQFGYCGYDMCLTYADVANTHPEQILNNIESWG